jgi:hypothetical protein
MTGEIVGIVVFSAFMLCLIGFLLANLFVALYRERKLQRSQREGQDAPPDR